MRALSSILAILLLATCVIAQEPSAPSTPKRSNLYVGLTGFVDWNWPPLTGTELMSHANVDMLLLVPDRFQPGADVTPDVIDSMRAVRKCMRIGSYFPAFFVYGWQKEAAAAGSLDPNSYSGEWWYQLSPYIAHTDSLDPNTGLPDSASVWKSDYVIDISNPECRRKMIDIWNRHRSSTDWVMLDFCSSPIYDMKQWQGIKYQNQEHGDLDLDQNGIPQKNDPIEIEIQRQAFYDLVTELRAAMPEWYLIIPNGTMALEDTVFTKLVDGMFVESWTQLLTGWRPINYLDYAGALAATNPIGVPVLTKPNRYRINPGYVLLENQYDQDDRKYLTPFLGAVSVKITTGTIRNTKLFVY